MWTGECDVDDDLESTDQSGNSRERDVLESDWALNQFAIQ